MLDSHGPSGEVRGVFFLKKEFEPEHDKTNKMTCAPREDSDNPGHQSSQCS